MLLILTTIDIMLLGHYNKCFLIIILLYILRYYYINVIRLLLKLCFYETTVKVKLL